MNIKDIANKQLVAGAPNLTVTEAGASAEEALKIMKKFMLHHLLVLTGERIAGVVSDRDILAHAVGESGLLSFSSFSVSDVMRTDFPAIHETTAVSDGLSMMVDAGLSALPILKDGKVVGIVTESDMLRALQKLLKKQLPSDLLISKGETLLAKPFTQSLIELFAEIGL